MDAGFEACELSIIIIESPDGTERVLILQRQDGAFTYRRQWRSDRPQPCNLEEEPWSPPGPDCGIYDSVDTAETEARQRIPWLKSLSH
jgi:hypothetical protein